MPYSNSKVGGSTDDLFSEISETVDDLIDCCKQAIIDPVFSNNRTEQSSQDGEVNNNYEELNLINPDVDHCACPPKAKKSTKGKGTSAAYSKGEGQRTASHFPTSQSHLNDD
mmetsp:Transcript_20324/g.29788  ORF Transcript_20324/g.29788 Transcript_20324/m.29788 type:complete len:112 (+) Transcript_20324:77-412(+)